MASLQVVLGSKVVSQQIGTVVCVIAISLHLYQVGQTSYSSTAHPACVENCCKSRCADAEWLEESALVRRHDRYLHANFPGSAGGSDSAHMQCGAGRHTTGGPPGGAKEKRPRRSEQCCCCFCCCCRHSAACEQRTACWQRRFGRQQRRHPALAQGGGLQDRSAADAGHAAGGSAGRGHLPAVTSPAGAVQCWLPSNLPRQAGRHIRHSHRTQRRLAVCTQLRPAALGTNFPRSLSSAVADDDDDDDDDDGDKLYQPRRIHGDNSVHQPRMLCQPTLTRRP